MSKRKKKKHCEKGYFRQKKERNQSTLGIAKYFALVIFKDWNGVWVQLRWVVDIYTLVKRMYTEEYKKSII